MIERAQGTGHRAQGTGHRAQGTGHRAQGTVIFSKLTLIAFLFAFAICFVAPAWATTVDVTVNVTGSGSVSIGNQTATEGNPFTTSVDDGASVTLTIAPDAGNIVTSAKLSYKPSEDGTAVDDIAISGSTATFQMPNDIWNGTGVTINVTFGAGLVGGADEASAVALTDATVSNLAGGYYKVESDISFDHTLNLIGNTYLVIASGAKMTVSSSEYGINGELYALNVLGEGTLNVTTTGSYKIAVCVSSYTQSGCSVNLTTSFMGMRCSDSFNISGGSFKTNGSEGIWPDNAVNISGGKLEASNIDANINLSYSNTDDYIKVDNYTSGKTMTIANGQTFTDGTTNYSGTITNLSPLNGKKLFPFVYMHLTVRDATCTEVGIKQECWQRSSDGKYFSDENGTNELNASDVEIPMIAHNGIPHEATDTHIAYWQCSVCSKYFSNSGCTTEITEEDTKIYRTITIDDGIRDYVTSNVDKAVAGTTVTLTVSHLINASTLQVNGGSVTLTDAGNGTYTFTVPAADVTVTASTATTYSVNLPANMEIVSATNTADGSGKYISGTEVSFKAKFPHTASNVKNGSTTLTATDGVYSVTVGTADITVTATIEHSSNIDLSQAPSDFTVTDGDVLTGSTSHTVTIADGAGITLSNATISGGIVCEGSATITLVGENSVSNTWYSSAGIQIGGSGTTLTIRGNGSLNVTGGSQSAGIGLGRTWDANATGGSVVIEGGTITASGGNGIGTGTVGNSMTAHMDGIIIKGGTVNARLGKGTINNGSSVTIGTIKIYDGIEKVDASAITESVTYMHDETVVTASASTYFTIIVDGDRRVITPKDDTDYTITIDDDTEHGTIAYAATTAKYGDKITITATPDFGYRLSSLVVKDAQNNDVASTGNSFFMPQSNVTVSAVFEQGTHGTTEFVWGYYGSGSYVTEATIYDGVTTVNLQQERSYSIIKYSGYSYSKFLLDNDTYNVNIPYAGGTGAFQNGNGTNFCLGNDATAGFYDITMTDIGNGKWSVSILKTAAAIDDIPDQEYTGSAITPEPLVMAGSLSLTKGTDYEYSYANNTSLGTAKVTVTFKGTYASLGSVEKEFTIIPTPTFTVTAAKNLTYNGSSQALVEAGAVTGGKLRYKLEGETDYGTTIPRGTEAKKYTVWYYAQATDTTHYRDSTPKSLDVTIAPLGVTVTITGHKNTATYDGSQHSVSGYEVNISNTLYTAEDFTFSGTASAARTDAGTANMGLRPAQFTNKNNNFDVSFEVTDGGQTINPKPVTSPTITLNPGSYVYNGTAHEPEVTVSDGGTVIPEKEYTVSYANNVAPGTATVTISDNSGGNYIVSGSQTFEITWDEDAAQPGVPSAPREKVNDDGSHTTERETVFMEPWEGGITIASVDIAITTEGANLAATMSRDFSTAVSVDVQIQQNYGYRAYTLLLDVTGLPEGIAVAGKTLFENVPLASHDFTVTLEGTPTAADAAEVKIAATVTLSDTLPFLTASADKTVTLTVSKEAPENETNPDGSEKDNTGGGQNDDSGQTDGSESGDGGSTTSDDKEPVSSDGDPEAPTSKLEELSGVTGGDSAGGEGSGESNKIPAAASNEEVTDSPVADKTVREIVEGTLGEDMAGVTFVPMTSVDQTDKRTTEQKTEAANKAIESRSGDTGRTVTFAFVLRPMRPTMTGIHSFHLPLPDSMNVGDFLVWCPGEKAKSSGAGATVAASLETGGAVFIDEATNRSTDVVPESRRVTVAAYLDATKEYEPVILTEKASGPSSPTSDKDSGGGCDGGLLDDSFAIVGLLLLAGVSARRASLRDPEGTRRWLGRLCWSEA